MKTTGIVLVQNEEEFIGKCLNGIYDALDEIVVISDTKYSFTGEIITPDNTVNVINNFPDPKNKIVKIFGEFYDPNLAPLYNDRKQREIARNSSRINPDIFFVADSDEIWKPEILKNVIKYISDHFDEGNYFRAKAVLLFRKLYNGETLAVALKNRNKFYFQNISIAYKPELKPKFSRLVEGNIKEVHVPLSIGLLEHHSFIKDETRMYEKLMHWGHAHDKTEEYFEKWFKEKWLCADLNSKNVGLHNPSMKPRLRKYEPAMLEAIMSTNNNLKIENEITGFFRKHDKKKRFFLF
ncbi:MAG: hypothetical protein DKM50_05965 [Candidatus Margulisiibacteriota bacterium]|nr:MAG: hypothetical protein A2X43_10390 [Candidatus Margulisbacteria bacterium GWD2_39_127]OGI05412.1 MAG: hypothetical protein A2X42_09120 [Candidatus Margulisbacteria bacterium GWF2_38_17]OGI07850.1 MAG: hypothetical protein A2X41_12035 [Candidatus Margulisbacteria bacterium GWE2_39_32]PZM80094.1 MAG: hypothetical protein DKM50_05965 [Candidatus Margulisiibacteriota bacterium]HAR62642.1 hypothetical protein [Candidatus Margulisiibacteriota bacterium]